MIMTNATKTIKKMKRTETSGVTVRKDILEKLQEI